MDSILYDQDTIDKVLHCCAATLALLQLIDQLKLGGRLILPVGPEGQNQMLVQIEKQADGKIVKTDLMGVIYVPLTSKDKQYSK